MNVVYHEKAKQWQEAYDSMELATEGLREKVGDALDPVDVEWDWAEDERNGGLFKLKLRDFAGEVEERFTKEEMRRPKDVDERANSLLGKLLMIRSRKLRQEMRAARTEE
jgi:hypothetical protein